MDPHVEERIRLQPAVVVLEVAREVLRGDVVVAALHLEVVEHPNADLGADAVKAKIFRVITDRGTFAAELPADADWHRARLALNEAFARRGDGAKILAEANGLEYSYGGAKVERKTSAGFVWKPSAQYSTLLDAFEEGVAWNTMS